MQKGKGCHGQLPVLYGVHNKEKGKPDLGGHCSGKRASAPRGGDHALEGGGKLSLRERKSSTKGVSNLPPPLPHPQESFILGNLEMQVLVNCFKIKRWKM